MTESPEPSELCDQRAGRVNPKTTASLVADYEAVRNDLEQASGLAAEFQRQLSRKSTECAQFKQVFEKTTKDLAHLQTSIAALREERHRLANEAMMATALQMKLTKAAEERDRLRAELDAARMAADESARTLHTRDQQIAKLTIKVVTLNEILVDAQHRSAARAPQRAEPREPKTAAAERQGYQESECDSDGDDSIEIAFGQ